MISLQNTAHTDSIWLAAKKKRSTDTNRTTYSAWCFLVWAPVWAADVTAAPLETKNTSKPKTAEINTETTNSDLRLFVCSESKISQAWSGFSSAILFPHLVIWNMPEKRYCLNTENSWPENCTISACCSWVLFVIYKQPLMYCWFSDTVVAHQWLNFNHAVSAYFKVFPYSLPMCLCYCMVLWMDMEIPDDFNTFSRKSIYCTNMRLPSSGISFNSSSRN